MLRVYELGRTRVALGFRGGDPPSRGGRGEPASYNYFEEEILRVEVVLGNPRLITTSRRGSSELRRSHGTRVALGFRGGEPPSRGGRREPASYNYFEEGILRVEEVVGKPRLTTTSRRGSLS